MNVDNKKVIKNYKIYALYNNVTDDSYIGLTCLSLNKRFRFHRNSSKTKDYKLYSKTRELGFENFKIVELLSAQTDWIELTRQSVSL